VKVVTATRGVRKSPRAADVRAELARFADPERAKSSARFFKTGPGEYGEGDRFLGVTVPVQRAVARQFHAIPLAQLDALLRSGVHEERLTALLILVRQYEAGTREEQEERVRFYLANAKRVNNWDLVDSSAPRILGAHLLTRDRAVLRRLARSKDLWERRIAVIATHAFIVAGESKDIFRLAEMLLDDKHDLMHKAIGWMLREVGKRVGLDALGTFLEAHATRMPRTMLRYSIERFPESERRAWLQRKAAQV
jgi:3-methyladenine DNA glycosylase AlkD